MIQDNEQEVTMVGELIEILSALPPDTPILATWEGVFERMAVNPELFHGKLIINCEAGREYYGDYGYGDNKGHGWY